MTFYKVRLALSVRVIRTSGLLRCGCLAYDGVLCQHLGRPKASLDLYSCGDERCTAWRRMPSWSRSADLTVTEVSVARESCRCQFTTTWPLGVARSLRRSGKGWRAVNLTRQRRIRPSEYHRDLLQPEEYIREALDGFAAQRPKFPVR